MSTSASIAQSFEAARDAIAKTGPIPREELLRRSADRIKPSRLDEKEDLIASLDNIQFYKDFSVAPGAPVRDERTGTVEYRRYDFRLTADEEAKLRRLGFVVSKRLQADSFAEIYYRIYSDDLPVYITTDSVLHAWHRSFDTFIVELEEATLIPLLDRVLSQCRVACRSMLARASDDAHMTRILQDVEFYLSVPLTLLNEDSSGLDMGIPTNHPRVERVRQAIDNGNLEGMDLFGASRDIDFSLFKPRGH
ncbi:hypothetical protein PINS_up002212 [Pythium insidiosum]|nr:hypothetical protein PINS_up002212 [Pythium insidiosum]